MSQQTVGAQIGADFATRLEQAHRNFVTGVVRVMCQEEALRAHEAGEDPSEERVQDRLRQMTTGTGETTQ